MDRTGRLSGFKYIHHVLFITKVHRRNLSFTGTENAEIKNIEVFACKMQKLSPQKIPAIRYLTKLMKSYAVYKFELFLRRKTTNILKHTM